MGSEVCVIEMRNFVNCVYEKTVENSKKNLTCTSGPIFLEGFFLVMVVKGNSVFIYCLSYCLGIQKTCRKRRPTFLGIQIVIDGRSSWQGRQSISIAVIGFLSGLTDQD